MSRKILLAVIAACLGACASNPTSSAAEKTSESGEKVCHWETGSRFGARDRRVCRSADAS